MRISVRSSYKDRADLFSMIIALDLTFWYFIYNTTVHPDLLDIRIFSSRGGRVVTNRVSHHRSSAPPVSLGI